MKCRICSRETIKKSAYCELHSEAYESIIRKYDIWRKALALSWKEYLSEIANNSSTGEWAREVAEDLVENE